MRTIVCGGRDFTDADLLNDTLNAFQITVLAEGGARGADALASAWARERSIPVQTYRADWRKYQRAAGPRRNLLMLSDFRPDLVIAFPGGTGTAHCVRTARNLGFPVTVIGAEVAGGR
jgi:hypothetical protein